MGHQKSTLTIDDLAFTVELYTETEPNLEYEKITAQVEMETANGHTYVENKTLGESESGMLAEISNIFTSKPSQKELLNHAVETVITQSEEELETVVQISSDEVVTEFEENINRRL